MKFQVYDYTSRVVVEGHGSKPYPTHDAARAEARAVASAFPASYRVKYGAPVTCGSSWRAYVKVEAELSPNEINGGENEVGLRRIEKFIRKARKLGHAVEAARHDEQEQGRAEALIESAS